MKPKLKISPLAQDYLLGFATFVITALIVGAFGYGYVKYMLTTHVEVIDGCEYIRSHHFIRPVYTHKGNCNNPIHKHQKQ